MAIPTRRDGDQFIVLDVPQAAPEVDFAKEPEMFRGRNGRTHGKLV